jgi:hypothetical protein
MLKRILIRPAASLLKSPQQFCFRSYSNSTVQEGEVIKTRESKRSKSGEKEKKPDPFSDR